MKSQSFTMGTMPCCWVTSGVHRSLTFRFVYAAKSWAQSCGDNGLRPVRKKSPRRIKVPKEDNVLRTFWCRNTVSCSPGHLGSHPRIQCSYNSTSALLFPSPKEVRSLRSTSSRPRSSGKGVADSIQPGDNKYIDWWEEKMKQCQKPSTQELIKRLVFTNLLGLDSSLRNGNLKEGALSRELLDIKRKFPHEVILARVGEFYESSGFDACILAEYAGLNPMGGLSNSTTVPRAGCPIANLRQTLDALTRNGFSVCIVEEVKGPSDAKKRKERFVSGHAHPGSPYVYGLAEADFDVDFPDPVSIVGIARSASGYSLISVVELMRSISVEDRLTEEAVVAKLRAKPFQRLFLHKSLRDKSTETVRWGEFGEGGLLWAECRGQNPEWYESDPVSELLSKVRDIFDLEEDVEFRRIVSPPGERPRPLNLGTASQVGILRTEGVPSLLRVLLPPETNGLCVAYLRDLLLNPPPYRVAVCIQAAIRIMNDIDVSIPDFGCVSAAKLVKLIGAMEANHLEFARIRDIAQDVLLMEKDPQLSALLGSLLDPTWLATGLRLEQDQLLKDCKFLGERLDEVLAPIGDPCNSISRSKFVPDEFYDDMEVRWKARVRRETVEKAYSDVDRAAASLSDAIEADFHPIVLRTKGLAAPLGGGGGGAYAEICYSSQNRAVWLKGKRFLPTLLSGGPGEQEIKRLREAKDAKGKKVGDDWFTTDRVDNALDYYRSAVERASAAVLASLKGLAAELQCKLNVIVFVATFSIVAKTLFAHAIEAKRRKWVVPEVPPSDGWGQSQEELVVNGDSRKNRGGQVSLLLEDLFPYWLDKSQDQVVLNTIPLESMILLTGPNGGGKSSILRSICAAALLATCGLMVPSRTAVVPRLDSIMLRMMIADSPADSKSSFQMEMSELRTILSEATEKSLVLVDELCKGTEVNKGTFIVASVLEHLDHVGCLGVISTHLHGLLDMDLDIKRVVRKAMGVEFIDAGRPRPTWRLVDGECRESLAFETARKEGVPTSIVERAEEFYRQWTKTLHSGRMKTRGLQDAGNGVSKAVYIDVSVQSEGQLHRDDQTPATSELPKSSSGDPTSGAQCGSNGQRQVLDVCEEITGDSRMPTADSENDALLKPGKSSTQQRLRLRASPQMMQSPGGEFGEALDNLRHVFLKICSRKLSDLYEVQLSGMEGYCECFVVGPRQKPPPMVTNHSCVYILKRPDGKFYVGQTDDLAGRMERHRSTAGLHEAPFVYVPLPNKSVACAVETCLIRQLPSFGFVLMNKADQHHKNFGTETSLTYGGGESPPF